MAPAEEGSGLLPPPLASYVPAFALDFSALKLNFE